MSMKHDDPWTLRIRQRMAHYRKEPPAGLLDEVKREVARRQADPAMAPRPQGRAHVVKLRHGAVAAAVIAAALLVWRGLVPEEGTPTVAQAPRAVSPSMSPGAVVATSLAVNGSAATGTETRCGRGGNGLVRMPVRRVADVLGGDAMLADSTAVPEPEAFLANNDDAKQSVATSSQQMRQHSTHASISPAQDDAWQYTVRQRHGASPRFSVQAAYGGGAGASSGGNGMLLAMANPYGDYASTMSGKKSGGVVYGTEATKEERHHNLPVNVGVTVRYGLSDRWALHTGVTYSYLKSEFKRYGVSESRSIDQRLHYLGLPLAVSCDVWQGRRTVAYVKAGGLVQKLVGGKADTHHQKDGRQYATHENVRESRPQFSMSLAAGAAWNVAPQVGVFVEPGLGYYFNNGSLVENIYKAHPLNFELNMGLRINISK